MSQKVPVAIAAFLLAVSSASYAQDPAGAEALRADAHYPQKTVRIMVGFTPGGGPDITARHIAQKLSESWKQQVLVENRPGAGGTVAAGLVAKAPPDGYTLLSVSSAHAVAAAIYPKLPYDTFADLSGVTLTGNSKYVLVAAPSAAIGSVRQLIDTAKAKPGALNFSSAGVGSGTHFAGEIFKSMAGIDVVHVPFKGIPEAMGETVAGRVHFFMAPIANAVNLVKDGRLTGLGVSSLQRDALLPDLPSIHEAGVANYQSILWFGLLTGAGVPRPILAKLNRDISRILADADTKSRWSPIGIEPAPTSPEEFDRVIRNDAALFAKIARSANIRAD